MFIIVPTPTVSVTAPNTQTVGQSLTLQCEVTTVRGITSRVDIVWRRDNAILNTTSVVPVTTVGNLLVYRDSYTIPQLSASDDGIMYECGVVVHSSSPVRATDTIQVDVTGKYFNEFCKV